MWRNDKLDPKILTVFKFKQETTSIFELLSYIFSIHVLNRYPSICPKSKKIQPLKAEHSLDAKFVNYRR